MFVGQMYALHMNSHAQEGLKAKRGHTGNTVPLGCARCTRGHTHGPSTADSVDTYKIETAGINQRMICVVSTFGWRNSAREVSVWRRMGVKAGMKLVTLIAPLHLLRALQCAAGAPREY